MSKKTGIFKVYFEDNGDLMYRTPWIDSWASQRPGYVPPKSEDNHVFHDHLEYAGYRKNSIVFKSLNSGRKYHMLLLDFDKMMQVVKMHHNVVEGDFTFTRRGTVQALKMILPKKP